MTDHQPINLATLAHGAAVEKFEECLGDVLENILDPNTDPEAARKVVLTVTFKPAKDRSYGAVAIKAEAKLAPRDPVACGIFIGRRHGKATAVAENASQAELFPEAEGRPVAVPEPAR